MPAAPTRIVVRGAAHLTASGARVGVDVLIEDGVIRAVGAVGELAGASNLRANGCLVVPGFIDVHVHGAGGDVFEQGGVEGNARISAVLGRYGTVGCVATLATLPPDRLRAAVTAIAAVRGREPGTRILGIHLEGPFLNPRRCGAQNPAWMRPPAIEEVDALQEQCEGGIRMVTVAPELDGALDFIRALRHRGIAVAIGHSEATMEQVEAAIAVGVTHVTHLFNAMSPLHHRAPGIAGVALTDDALTVEVICDGHHLHPRAVDLIFRCKPPHRIAMVTDAVAAGMPEGTHDVFGVRCEVRGGTVRTATGQLAGSCLTMDAAVRNVRAWQPGRTLGQILACASAVPARVIAANPVSLSIGADADLVLLSDDMRVAATFVKGRCVWSDADRVVAQG
jgi:N-acetylglucosamine-6-phosphate deacetylase